MINNTIRGGVGRGEHTRYVTTILATNRVWNHSCIVVLPLKFSYENGAS